MIGFGQLTYVPDNFFESYLESNGMGNGIPNDDYVTTANIDTVISLDISFMNISDLTGIEDFTALIELYIDDNNINSLDVSNNTLLEKLSCYFNSNLPILDISNNTSLTYLNCHFTNLTILDVSNNTALTYLDCNHNNLTNLDVNTNVLLEELVCSGNQLTSLDVSTNVLLEELDCSVNQLTNLDVSTNTSLKELYCFFNNLTSLNVNANTDLIYLECFYNNLINLNLSTNTSLEELFCGDNQLTSLDVSANTALTELHCEDNQLTTLDLRNGNNTNMSTSSSYLNFAYNPNLTCISVDDAVWSTTYWTVANGNIDAQHYFSTNCPPPSAIEEHSTNKELLRTIDVLGRETKNKPLFYIYDDGTVEKRITID